MKNSPKLLGSVAGFLAVGIGSGAAALTVSPSNDASALVASMLAADSGINVSAGSETLIGDEAQQGTFSGFNLSPTDASQPTLTLPDGAVLTTGTANFSTTENTEAEFSVETGQGDHEPLVDLAETGGLSTFQFDSNVLSFDFTLEDPTLNAITGKFLFATEEFPTESVTDIMGIFLNGVNFAFFPNGDLVSNQSGDPNDFFNNNPVGSEGYPIEWNGLTNVFSFTALAIPGEVNTFSLAIADTDDQIFDSAVFLGGLTAGSTTGGGGIGPVDPVQVIPLPAAGWMLLAGLGALGALRRRRRD